MVNAVEIILKGTDLTGPAFASSIKHMKEVGHAASSMFALFAGGAAIGAVGSLAALTEHSIEAAAEMGKLAQKAGLPVEQFSQLSFAANLVKIDSDALVKSFKFLGKEMIEQGRSSESLLDQILAQADVFAKMPDGIEKTARAVALFGRTGQDLIPLLNQGSDAIREQMREADKFGLTISSSFAKDSEEFEVNVKKMKASLVGMGNEFAKTVLPELKKFSEWVLESQAIPIFFETITKSIEDMTAGIKGLIQAAQSLPQHGAAAQSGGVGPSAGLNSAFNAFKRREGMPGGTASMIDEATAALVASQFIGPMPFIGPPMGPRARTAGTGNAGTSAIDPGAQAQIDNLAKWEQAHADALMRAQELEDKFNVAKLTGSEQERARIDADYQHWLTTIAQMRLDEDESINLSNQAWEAHHEMLRRLQAQTFAQNADLAARGFGAVAQLAGAFGKKWFALQQAMRYGEAVMHGAAGIARAFADWPWPYSAVVAGIVGVETAAQIATIASQKGPQAHSGLDFVPDNATYALERGEGVIKRDQNERLAQFLDNPPNIRIFIGSHEIKDFMWDSTRDGSIAVHPRAVRDSL